MQGKLMRAKTTGANTYSYETLNMNAVGALRRRVITQQPEN